MAENRDAEIEVKSESSFFFFFKIKPSGGGADNRDSQMSFFQLFFFLSFSFLFETIIRKRGIGSPGFYRIVNFSEG